MLFDFAAQRWSELATATSIFAVGIRWSADSRYVYFQDFFKGAEQPIFRVRVSDRKVEQIASSRQMLNADLLGYSMDGLAPDDSPLVTLIHANSDVYALDLTLP